MKKTVTTLSTFLLFFTTILAQPLYVSVKEGLHVREYGDNGSTSLVVIPYGTEIQATDLSNESYGGMTSRGLKGNWKKITYKEKTGYVFDGFLLPIPPPEGASVSISDYIDKHYKKLSGPDTYKRPVGDLEDEYVETTYEKGIYKYRYTTAGYHSTSWFLTELDLPQTLFFCKLFQNVAAEKLLNDDDYWPMREENKDNMRYVKYLKRTDNKIDGIYISYPDKPYTFEIKENEGRIQLTITHLH